MTDMLEYSYRPKLGVMLLAIGFFVACAIGLGNAAISNPQALPFDGILHLDPSQATLLY